MMDSIERVLTDCTKDPISYCVEHGCGQGAYDELADYLPDACIHLVGRAVAVTRHAILGTEDDPQLEVGDRIVDGYGNGGTVIGYASDSGRLRLVVDSPDAGILLVPQDEAKAIKVPTMQDLKDAISAAIRDASEDAGAEAERLADLAMAVFDGREVAV